MSVFFDKDGFLERLELLRQKAGLSKGEFADKVGVAQIFSRYRPPKPGQKERKVKAPSVETLIRIADVFHVSVDWLLSGEEQRGAPGPDQGAVTIRRPQGEDKPVSDLHVELLNKTLMVLLADGEAQHFAESLQINIESSYRGVQLANRVSGSPGSKAAEGS